MLLWNPQIKNQSINHEFEWCTCLFASSHIVSQGCGGRCHVGSTWEGIRRWGSGSSCLCAWRRLWWAHWCWATLDLPCGINGKWAWSTVFQCWVTGWFTGHIGGCEGRAFSGFSEFRWQFAGRDMFTCYGRPADSERCWGLFISTSWGQWYTDQKIASSSAVCVWWCCHKIVWGTGCKTSWVTACFCWYFRCTWPQHWGVYRIGPLDQDWDGVSHSSTDEMDSIRIWRGGEEALKGHVGSQGHRTKCFGVAFATRAREKAW